MRQGVECLLLPQYDARYDGGMIRTAFTDWVQTVAMALAIFLVSADAPADDDVVQKLVAQWKQQRSEIESLQIISEKLTQPCPGVPQEAVAGLTKELLSVLNGKDQDQIVSRKAARDFMEAMRKKRIDSWSKYEILVLGFKLRNTVFDAAGNRLRDSVNSNGISIEYSGGLNNQYDITDRPRAHQYGKDFVRAVPLGITPAKAKMESSDDATYTLLAGDPMRFYRARVRKEDGLAEFISESDRKWIIQGHFERYSGIPLPRFTYQISFGEGKATHVSCHWVTSAEVNLKLTEEDFHIPLTSGGLINDYRDSTDGEEPHQTKFKSPFDVPNVLEVATSSERDGWTVSSGSRSKRALAATALAERGRP